MRAAAVTLAVAAAAAALAQGAPLVSGPGVGLVGAKCGTCHDLTHISRSKLSRNEWTDNFDNMLKRGMPPVGDAERAIILDYLVAYYGPGPAPAPGPDTLAGAALQSAGLRAGDKTGELAGARGCTACHAVDKPLVGPAFKLIAQRYRSDPGAAPRLAEKVRRGGVGVWGNTPMPPHSALAESEINELVGWVLAQQ